MYILRLCYDVIVHLSVTEVHWRIIANIGFKFRSQFTAHCGRHGGRAARRAACGRIISRHLASARSLVIYGTGTALLVISVSSLYSLTMAY